MGQFINDMKAAVIKELHHDEKSGWTMVFCFPEQFVGFSGHFPDAPVLPAIVQVQAAQIVAETFLEKPLRLHSVTRAKFHIQIRPGDHMIVSCSVNTADTFSGTAVDAKIVMGGRTAASFCMHFTNEGTE